MNTLSLRTRTYRLFACMMLLIAVVLVGAQTPAQAADAITMYRLYNPYSGEHLYTKDLKEQIALVKLGWHDEGVAWLTPTSGDPIYRLYNPYSSDHHYTMDAKERDSLVKLGWKYEGIGWYSSSSSIGVPVYRQFNPYEQVGTHNYTLSKTENDTLAQIGWKAEGIAWYAVSEPASTISSGVYRLQSAGSNAASIAVQNGSLSANVSSILASWNDTLDAWWNITPTDSGYYKLTNSKSGLVLSVSKTSVLSTVVQSSNTSSEYQQWKFVKENNGAYRLVNRATGYTIDTNNSTSPGTTLRVAGYTGSVTQTFTLTSLGTIYSLQKDTQYVIRTTYGGYRALEVAEGSLSQGANVDTASLGNTLSQRWELSAASGGYVQLRSANSYQVLAISGTNVVQTNSGSASAAAQQWLPIKLSEGGIILVNRATGKVLDINSRGDYDGANAQIYDYNGSVAQKFGVTESAAAPVLTNGTYAIHAWSSTDLSLDIPGGSRSNGASTQLYTFNASRAQLFTFTHIGNGYYKILSAQSGLALTAGGSTITQQVWNGATTQQWRVVPSPGGGYALINRSNGGALVPVGYSVSSTNQLSTATTSDTKAIVWWLDAGSAPAAKTWFMLQSVATNGYLVPTGSTNNDAVKTSSQVSGNTALWTSYTASGYANFYTWQAAKMLDVTNASTRAGAVIMTYQKDGSESQKWQVKYTSDGAIVLVDKNSGLALTVDSAGAVTQQKLITDSAGNPTSASQKLLVVPTNEPSGITYVQQPVTLNQAIAAQEAVDRYDYGYSVFYRYMDPATIESYGERYTFAKISQGYSGLTAAQLNAFIDSTGVGRSGKLHGLGQAFVDAAQKYQINEAYLLAHAILETGWGQSTLATGKVYNGKTYYNFYGIGAFDDSAVESGSAYAVQQGWDSPYNAVVGGARWISGNYIFGRYSQDTLYTMRFNLINGSATHQYATGSHWAGDIAQLMNQIYAMFPKDGISFAIPRYIS